MDINIGEERIFEIVEPPSAQPIQERAASKKVEAFGQIARFVQRAKPEEIEITRSEKRYAPFWLVKGSSRYVYERRRRYKVDVAPEVRTVTLYEKDHPVTAGHFELEGLEHSEEGETRELSVDALTGTARDFSKYLALEKREIPTLDALRGEGVVLYGPEVRSSVIVGTLTKALLKTIAADKILEQRIEVEHVSLYFRPLYAFEYYWKPRDKYAVIEFDPCTGESRAESGQIKAPVMRVQDRDALFDIGKDEGGQILPGLNIAVKLGRLAPRKPSR